MSLEQAEIVDIERGGGGRRPGEPGRATGRRWRHGDRQHQLRVSDLRRNDRYRPARVTGRGAGLDDAGLERKVAVIRRGLELHEPDPADPVGVLAAVGGFEIGFLAGLMLGLAERRVAIALDGFIVTSAALIAHALNPRVVDYMFACHLSVEPGHRVALDHLGLRPLVDLEMGLGEGSGAAIGMTIIDAAVRLHSGMATFDEAAVSGRTDAAP